MKSNRFNDSPHQFTYEERKSLEKAWNANINGSMTSRLSIGKFAKQYGIVKSTLSRELNRGCVSPCYYDNVKHQWCYAEYSAQLAQEDANVKGSEKGPRGKLTSAIGKEIIDIMKNNFSVCTALNMLIEDRRSKGVSEEDIAKEIPSQRTLYYHLEAGTLKVTDGHVFYAPRPRKRHGKPLMYGKVCPGNRRIEERPSEVETREEFGHWEMDSVLSCRDGIGGLLVLIERKTRLFIIRYLKAISQEAVLQRLKEIMDEDCMKKVLSVTTDNGCEFINQKALDEVFQANTYYTHAYASWEKGSVENANRMIRRWYPKGFDFSRLNAAKVKELQDNINKIVRPISLKGQNASQAFEAAVVA